MTKVSLTCSTLQSAISFKTVIVAWLPALSWMVIIYLFSDQPYSGEVTLQYFGGLNTTVRKLAHISEFGILLYLFRFAFLFSSQASKNKPNHRSPKRLFAWLSFTFTILYAIFDEWHQSFVAGRSASCGDVFVDTTGAFVGLLAWWTTSKKFAKKNMTA